MRGRKLVQLLERFHSDERKEFAEFLRSPLHARRPKLGLMVELIDQHVISRPEKKLNSEAYYALVYPGKRYDANNLNRLISTIMRELKNYLSYLQYRQDKGAQYMYYVKECGDRKWKDLLKNAIPEVEKRLETEMEESEEQYHQKFKLAIQRVAYLLSDMPKNPGLLYQESLDRLDDYYMLAKLRTMTLAKNHDFAHSTEHEYRFEDLAPEKLAKSVLNNRLTTLYSQLFRITDAQNGGPELDEYVETLRREIPHYDEHARQIDQGPKLAKSEAELLYGLGLNQIHKVKVKEGYKWVPLIDDMFNQAIQKGAFLKKGKLYDRLFINQIQMLCASGYTDLADSFFHEFVPLLEENPDNIVSDYCNGLILYFKEEMQPSWKLISNVKNKLGSKTDHFIYSGTRVMLCALWYEIGELDSMVHEAHAFRTWLGRETKRSKIRNAIDRRYCKVILSLERIIRGPTGEKRASLEKIREKVKHGKQNGTGLLLRIIDTELSKA